MTCRKRDIHFRELLINRRIIQMIQLLIEIEYMICILVIHWIRLMIIIIIIFMQDICVGRRCCYYRPRWQWK